MKFTKYRIIAESGKFYLEIPFLWVFWQRLYKSYTCDSTGDTWLTTNPFTTRDEAYNWAEKNKYGVLYTSKDK